MGAPKTPKINELEYNGRTSNKKGAGQKNFCPRIKGAPFIRYFRVIIILTKKDVRYTRIFHSFILVYSGKVVEIDIFTNLIKHQRETCLGEYGQPDPFLLFFWVVSFSSMSDLVWSFYFTHL